VVAGLAPWNDVSARDVQAGGPLESVVRAKTFPTFKPFGPALATLDEFKDPLDIGLTTKVNGELRQQVRSSDRVLSLPEIIEAVTNRLRTRHRRRLLWKAVPGAGREHENQATDDEAEGRRKKEPPAALLPGPASQAKAKGLGAAQ
jgi:hypothetical protein